MLLARDGMDGFNLSVMPCEASKDLLELLLL